MLTNDQIEEYISRFPIYQYTFLKPEDVEFSDDVRAMCKRICSRYDTNWSCPPAVAKVAKCRERCSAYPDVLFFSSVGAVEGKNRKSRNESKEVHEELTRHVEDYLINNGITVYTLTSDACTLCPKCNFPHEYCRHSELMHPCIESHGIAVPDLAEKCCMDYDLGPKLYVWFSLIYYKEAEIIPEEEELHE